MSRSPVQRDTSARAMRALEAELVTPPDLEARLLDLADGGLPARAMQALEAELVTPPDLEARLLDLAELEDSLLDLVTEDRGEVPPVIESKWAQLATARSRTPRTPRRLGWTTALTVSAAIAAIIGAAAWLLTMPAPAPKPSSSRAAAELLASRAKAGSVKAREDLYASSTRPEQEVEKLRDQLKASEQRAQQLEQQLKASDQRVQQLEGEVQSLRAHPR